MTNGSRRLRRRRPVSSDGGAWWLAAALTIAALVGTWALGAGVAQADDSRPTIAVSPAQAAVGDTLTVDLAGWPSGTVTASVCSNGAANGSADCSLPGQRTVEIHPDGTGHARLTVDPPGRCPCVVRVTTPRLDVVRVLEIAVPELGSDPLPGVDPAPGASPSTPVASAPDPLQGSAGQNSATTVPDWVPEVLVVAAIALALGVAWRIGRRSGRRLTQVHRTGGSAAAADRVLDDGDATPFVVTGPDAPAGRIDVSTRPDPTCT